MHGSIIVVLYNRDTLAAFWERVENRREGSEREERERDSERGRSWAI